MAKQATQGGNSFVCPRCPARRSRNELTLPDRITWRQHGGHASGNGHTMYTLVMGWHRESIISEPILEAQPLSGVVWSRLESSGVVWNRPESSGVVQSRSELESSEVVRRRSELKLSGVVRSRSESEASEVVWSHSKLKSPRVV